MDSLEVMVERDAMYLDGEAPGWAPKIDRNRFDMASGTFDQNDPGGGCGCVLAQLDLDEGGAGHYNGWLFRHGIGGLGTSFSPDSSAMSEPEWGARSTLLWTAEIEKRLEGAEDA